MLTALPGLTPLDSGRDVRIVGSEAVSAPELTTRGTSCLTGVANINQIAVKNMIL